MICKKCGREYEDDMPKCLWCDAPRESEPAQSELYCETYKDSPEKLADPKLEHAFAYNVYRGQSAISWTKFMIFINVIIFLVEVKTFPAINAGIEGLKVNIPLTKEFIESLIILIAFIFFAIVPSCVFIGKNWIWIYHAQKGLNKFTESFFSPWGAVLCYYIPVVNYFVFKDLLKNQNIALTTFGVKTRPIPNITLNCYLITIILTIVCNVINHFQKQDPYSTLYLLLSTIIWIIFIISNIKLIRVATENEQNMHDVLYNNMVNLKVEEIFAQQKADTEDMILETDVSNPRL